MRTVAEIVRESIAVKQRVLDNQGLLEVIDRVARTLIEAFRQDKKVLFCGNGGSAADAQHIAAELSGRFYFDRKPLYAEALHTNTSYLTAVANDYSYADIFARLVQGMGRPGDVLVAISTSGNSENVVRAVQVGRAAGMVIVGMTGEGGGKLRELCHHAIEVPSRDTARIQECHITIGHTLCELVEATLFGR